MKIKILLFLLVPFLTHCYTFAGAGIDSIRNKNGNNPLDTIQRENQLITFVTIHDVSLKVRYKGLIYKPDSAQHSLPGESNKEIINLPRIGDSLTVFIDNQRNFTGLFLSIEKPGSEYVISLFNKDSDYSDHFRMSSINKLKWNSNLFEIHDPHIDRFFMKYELNGSLHEIALSKLKHLNTDRPKQDNTFTIIGLGIDAIGVAGLIICAASNCLDFGFDE